MKITTLLSIALIVISFMVGIYFYPVMPPLIASHWGLQGEVNGYMPKFWGLFLMPIISSVMLALFIFLPKIDPLKENISKFRPYFESFILLLIGFLFYLYLITLSWNLGLRFNIIQALSPAFALLFYYIGVLLSHAKRNWFIGIRTPWTLSSDAIWDKTHKIGGKYFRYAAVISLFGIIFPQIALWFILVPIMTVSFYLYIYSYFLFRNARPGNH